ncbi:hypothetical protein, partial [Pseudomonas reactans]|uniref:hypothetical protein n=1 Tax=Pseudomonas reactans TaxID=117680 RepID=UPI001C4D6D90
MDKITSCLNAKAVELTAGLPALESLRLWIIDLTALPAAHKFQFKCNRLHSNGNSFRPSRAEKVSDEHSDTQNKNGLCGW